eukprot:CAMPEP_0177615842 /NCGR_PEP_ID=MMETSP0419_2-20121207/23745_1 /TAXON_ID=582737 /ORGANISM="Tetraselmis sp., Strain GSL018" /LENGTH=693 /DNA_ID=CAMNT_0019113675 /DNA_START=154 /DNA_END=2238 /DNA_ORIENTATION=+
MQLCVLAIFVVIGLTTVTAEGNTFTSSQRPRPAEKYYRCGGSPVVVEVLSENRSVAAYWGTAAYFGNPITETGTGPLSLELGDPLDGCAPFSGSKSTGGAVLVQRGECPFGDKAQNIENAGAALMLATNNSTGCLIMDVANEDTEGQPPSIWAAAVDMDVGSELRSLLANTSRVSVNVWAVRPGLDVSSAVLWLTAVLTVVLGSVWSAMDSTGKPRESSGTGGASMQDTVPTQILTEKTAALFIVMASAMLLLLFFLAGWFVMLMLVGCLYRPDSITTAATTGVAECLMIDSPPWRTVNWSNLWSAYLLSHKSKGYTLAKTSAGQNDTFFLVITHPDKILLQLQSPFSSHSRLGLRLQCGNGEMRARGAQWAWVFAGWLLQLLRAAATACFTKVNKRGVVRAEKLPPPPIVGAIARLAGRVVCHHLMAIPDSLPFPCYSSHQPQHGVCVSPPPHPGQHERCRVYRRPGLLCLHSHMGCLPQLPVGMAAARPAWCLRLRDVPQDGAIANLKVAMILLPLAFFYDVFWVFIQPMLTHSASVMVKVATGGNTQEAMPMVLRVPKFNSPFPGYSILGLGDIVLPGILVAFARTVDALKGRTLLRGYFAPLVTGYGLGLILTYLALMYRIGGQSGQPALLYLVPCTLCPMVALAAYRGELRQLMANRDSKANKQSDEEDGDNIPRMDRGDSQRASLLA